MTIFELLSSLEANYNPKDPEKIYIEFPGDKEPNRRAWARTEEVIKILRHTPSFARLIGWDIIETTNYIDGVVVEINGRRKTFHAPR